ncbi:hypothetical protein [Umezawaea beigongshangensis]|uniref:hypothetical protein n=1 Tax=Umezawaea beigongshangensis TaxID=2780383 RepID=UPI0018F24B2D|nr:hypothetical protein [Umezawaea beigongshangensis]
MTFPYDRAKLDALVARVDAGIAGVERTAAEASRVRTRSSGLTPQDLAEIERAARGRDAPKELRELQRRVDAGELTWSDVASGRALDDAGVQSALATSVPDLQRAHRALEDGQDPEDVAESGRPRSSDPDDDGPSNFTQDAW